MVVDESMETLRLLVVSREIAALRALWSAVEANAWHAETVASAWEAMDRLQSSAAPHLLLLDLPRGDRDSLHILRWLRRMRPAMHIMLLCHAEDAGKRQDAMRLGANEVLVKPFQEEEIQAVISCLAGFADVQTAALVSENMESLGGEESFVCASSAMQKLRAQAELLAQDDVPVLILGEKGSGKEATARLVHRLSVRSGFPFLKVNCTAFSSDLLEKELFGADSTLGKLAKTEKGTTYFEELTELPRHLQAQLLNILEGRRPSRAGLDAPAATNARILASTSAAVERALAEKKLREDLYNRLSAFTVHVPPLRQRSQEIGVLLHHFMHRLSRHYGLRERVFSAHVIKACEQYSWPGNVAQLSEFVKRYLFAGASESVMNELDSNDRDAPSHAAGAGLRIVPLADEERVGGLGRSTSLKSLMQEVKSETERSAIGLALEKTGWNRKAAAHLLNVSYRTLLYKIEHYQLKPANSPDAAYAYRAYR